MRKFPRNKQFTITRVFEVPRHVIWRAWTDPDETAHWWHPRRVTTPREYMRIDLRPGGNFEYRMVAPDFSEYPTFGEYIEVVPPERLVFTWADPGNLRAEPFLVTLTLSELDGNRTGMSFHLGGTGGRAGDGNIYDGWDQAFDILGERLAALAGEHG